MKILNRLIDFYSKPRQNGIFFAMFQDLAIQRDILQPLGITTDNEAHAMDMDYIVNKSGLKSLSTLLQYIINGYIIDSDDHWVTLIDGRRVTWDYIINAVDQDLINTIIVTKFKRKWIDLIATLNLDYDPLKPFSMSVDETVGDKLISKNTTKDTNTGTVGTNSNGAVTSTGSSNDNIYAFNSNIAQPTDSSENTDTNTTENNETITNDLTRDGVTDYTRNTDIKRNTSRIGNIGNKSAMQLITEQRELLRYQIFDIIYSDLDEVLTSSKYI